MKKNFKILFVISIFLCSSLFITNVFATENDILELYPIKDDKKIIDLIDFYQKNKNDSKIKIVVNENRLNKDIEYDNIDDTVYEEPVNNTEEIEENNNYYEENTNNYYEGTANFDSNYTDLANYALQFVGNPYVYGGTSLTEGADCSGFVMKLYEQYGVTLPRTSGAQATVGYGVSIENAQPGDIISYGYNGVVSHSAIYIGNEMIVHASTPASGIRTDSMYIMPIITIRRIG